VTKRAGKKGASVKKKTQRPSTKQNADGQELDAQTFAGRKKGRHIPRPRSRRHLKGGKEHLAPLRLKSRKGGDKVNSEK